MIAFQSLFPGFGQTQHRHMTMLNTQMDILINSSLVYDDGKTLAPFSNLPLFSFD